MNEIKEEVKERKGPDAKGKKGNPSKRHILIGIFQLFSAMFLALLLIVLYLSFGGEFVIIRENLWVVIVFTGIIIISAIYGTRTFIINAKTGKFRELKNEKLKKITNKFTWVLGWSIWNLIIGVILILLFFIIFVLVAEVLTTMFSLALMIVAVIIIAIPLFGYGLLFIHGSLKVFLNKIKRHKRVKITPGLTGAGFSFMFLLSSFVFVIALYNPQWSPGVQHSQLFVSGEQPGRGYRIPAMLALPGDVILAFCESRADPMLDWGDIDLIMKRSTDGGSTWGPIVTLRDEGTHSAGNPCPVYDKTTGMVWLPYCVDNKCVFVMNSSDLGITWSLPREITQEIGITLSGSQSQLSMEYGTGPGIGIQIASGRLVIPSYYFDDRGSHVLYSDDHGATWKKSTDLNNGGECQVFEAINGSININCRTSSGYRYTAWSSDGGETWQHGKLHSQLPEPGCMASVHRLTNVSIHGKNRVLYSGPEPYSRGHLTIRMTYDEGLTWPIVKEAYSGPSAYSQIIILSNLTICILFESGRLDYRENIVFIKMTLNWLEAT